MKLNFDGCKIMQITTNASEQALTYHCSLWRSQHHCAGIVIELCPVLRGSRKANRCKELLARTQRTNQNVLLWHCRSLWCAHMFQPSLYMVDTQKKWKTQGEGVVVCKNHLVGLNRVGLSYLEGMPKREYSRDT